MAIQLFIYSFHSNFLKSSQLRLCWSIKSLCRIHMRSSLIFIMHERLCLMGLGKQFIFSHSCAIFEAIPHVKRPQSLKRWVKCENYIVLSSIRIRVGNSHTSAIFLSLFFSNPITGICDNSNHIDSERHFTARRFNNPHSLDRHHHQHDFSCLFHSIALHVGGEEELQVR